MRTKSLDKQAGVLLLEGMIAILIFSIGILAIVGMQAAAVRQVGDAKYRSDASFLADQLVGMMWAQSAVNRTSAMLHANFVPGNSTYDNWMANVTQTLPNAQATVDVFQDISGTRPEEDGAVTITLQWKLPSEAANATPHQYVAIAHVK